LHAPFAINAREIHALTVSALITNYNTWRRTLDCVGALQSWSGRFLSKILVVDDGSTEPPPPALSASSVELVPAVTNIGYVACVNKGFRMLTEDIVLLLDSDARPTMDVINPIRQAFADDHNLGALGFRLVDEAGNATGSRGPEPDLWEFILGQQLGARYVRRFRDRPNSKWTLYSCALAVRKRAFHSVGGFDEGFDFLDADVDFSMRLRRAGWNLEIREDLTVYHTGGGSPQKTAQRVLRYHRNRLRLLEKHKRLPLVRFVKMALAARHAIELLVLRVMISAPRDADRETLREKMEGRRVLLRSVWRGYRLRTEQRTGLG
jgi:hypothetical protein